MRVHEFETTGTKAYAKVPEVGEQVIWYLRRGERGLLPNLEIESRLLRCILTEA